MTLPVDCVFLHGGGQGAWVWHETIMALQQQGGTGVARTMALDAPGCGSKRGRDTAALDIDAVVTELLTEMSAAGLGHQVMNTRPHALAEVLQYEAM